MAATLQPVDMSLWQQRIVVNPDILAGKPIVAGTRLSVELVIEMLANAWSEDDILRNYPVLTRDDIRACLHYASHVLQSERIYPLPA
jgi:uncharacterized protein (DUF433 family)